MPSLTNLCYMCPMMDLWRLNHILKGKDAYTRIYSRAARDIFLRGFRFLLDYVLPLVWPTAAWTREKQLLPRVLSIQKKRELNLTKEKTRKEARTTRNLGWDFWPPIPMRGKAANHQRSFSWFVPVHSGHKQPTLYRWYCSLLWWPGKWKSVSGRGPLTQLPERYRLYFGKFEKVAV